MRGSGYPGECVQKAGARWHVCNVGGSSVAPRSSGEPVGRGGLLYLLAGSEPRHDVEAFCGGMGWDPRDVVLVDKCPDYLPAMQDEQRKWPGLRVACDKIENVLARETRPVAVAYLDLMGIGLHMRAPVQQACRKLQMGGVLAITSFRAREKEGHHGRWIKDQLGNGDRLTGLDKLVKNIALSYDVVLHNDGTHNYQRPSSPMAVTVWRRVR